MKTTKRRERPSSGWELALRLALHGVESGRTWRYVPGTRTVPDLVEHLTEVGGSSPSERAL